MEHAWASALCIVIALPCWFALRMTDTSGGGQQQHTKDSLETVKASLSAKKAILVDVREKSEWDKGHLRDATLLSLSELAEKLSEKTVEKQFPPGTILYLHCAAGVRVLQAAEMLKKSGYDARPLRDGYQSLLKNGFLKAEK